MKVHNIDIFADKSFTPRFGALSNLKDVLLCIHSSDSGTPPKLTIFFNNIQEATNFKNAIIQSWEVFLKEKEAKKKS